MTNKVSLALLFLGLCALASCSSMPAYVDFTYARATPNSWQPADISLDYSHPLVYGNHLLLQNVHLIDGTFATYTMQATRQIGDQYWVRFESPDSLLSFSPQDMFFTHEYINDTTGWNLTGQYDVTIYAQNPSASGWYGPQGVSFENNLALSVWNAPVTTATKYTWKAKVACVNTTGGDCFEDFCVANPEALAFGFCWQDMITGSSGLVQDKPDLPILHRPVYLNYPATGQDAFSFDESWKSFSIDVYPGLPTQSFVLGLMDVAHGAEAFDVTAPAEVRKFYPGLDNNGGTITLDAWKLITVLENGTLIDTAVDTLPIEWTSQTLSYEQSTISFVITDVPGGVDVSSYYLFFRVSAEQNPSVITPSNSSQNSSEGTYNSGAYNIPFVVLNLKQIGIQFQNFPPGASGGVATIPISPPPPTEGYIITVDFTPAALGLDSISLPFTVIPAGAIQFYVGGVPIDPAVGFKFIGNSRVVAFGVATQTSAVSGVTLTFGTPIVTGSTQLANSAFTVPSSFSATFIAGGGSSVNEIVASSSSTATTASKATDPAASNSATSTSLASKTTPPTEQSSADIRTLALLCVLLAIAIHFA